MQAQTAIGFVERNWTDNRTRGTPAAEVNRNTPTLMNLRLSRWFAWDGGADSLWSQSLRPILDAREFGATPRHLFLTAPYAHQGEKPLQLSAQEQSALVVFLESISTFNNPWRPEDHARCSH